MKRSTELAVLNLLCAFVGLEQHKKVFCQVSSKDQNFVNPATNLVASMPLKDGSKTIYQKWSSRTKAHKMLQEGLKNGTIDATMKPKEVWESSIEFQRYSLASFRSAFNRKKTEMGVHLRDEGKFPKKHGSLHVDVLLLFLCFNTSSLFVSF
jgi:hypothetical protein